MLQVEVALKVLRQMVGVATGERGADGADNLLARITVKTSNMFLQTGKSPAITTY